MKFTRRFLRTALVGSALLLLVNGTTQLRGAADAGNNAGPAASGEELLSASTGKLDYQTDLFSGRFGYSVPIVAPPARNGSEPHLALRYNSSGANGWCGQGWELEIGHIQRETREGVPVKWNTGTGLPLNEYDDAKGFMFSLNGASSRLVNVASNEFRAEIESGFLRFHYLTNSSGNSWRVTDTSGNKFYFGETADSRMVNYKWGSTTNTPKGTFRWALNRSHTITGTTNQFVYQIIDGAQYPKEINYNGHANGIASANKIKFELTTTNRVDSRIAYNSGYGVFTGRRLSKIYCKVGGLLVRRYDLAYASSPSTLRSLLTGVTTVGLNGSSTLPPTTFTYQEQELGFQSVAWTNIVTRWTNSLGSTTTPDGWRFPTYPGETEVDLVDMDGDALPDRVFRSTDTNYPHFYLYQRNTGAGFAPLETNRWGTMTTQNSASGTVGPTEWNYIMGTRTRLTDINGDGRPDHVLDPIDAFFTGPYTNFIADINTGTGWSQSNLWANAESFGSTDLKAIENPKYVRLVDMNGDGLADRLMQHIGTGYQTNLWWIQFNTGSGFSGYRFWSPIDAQGAGYNAPDWWAIDNGIYSRLIDMNGDGLPDRVMSPKKVGPTEGPDYNNYTRFVVQFNNGYGFEPPVDWVNVNSTGDYTGGVTDYWSAIEKQGTTALRDINADGLPDRILGKKTTPYTKWFVQFNAGTRFVTNLVEITAFNSQGNTTDLDWSWIDSGSAVRYVDINADGLSDRVMVAAGGNYLTNWFVADLAKGPFPDLLSTANNGIGGTIKIGYTPAAGFNNRETSDPSSRGLLHTPMQVVASVASSDGIYPYYTNRFGYEGGFYDPVRREFAGFHAVKSTNALGQTQCIWFHQGGGRDEPTLGEFEDAGNFAKRGIPFRTQSVGTNGETYGVSLNKAGQHSYGSGRYFAFVSQSTQFDYPGTGAGARMTTSTTLYDTTNGGVTNSVAYGEISSFTATNHTFSGGVATDDVYQWTTFATLSNPDLTGKPDRTWVTSDTNGTSILAESEFVYDGSTGNLLQILDRICEGSYRTNLFFYNGYGNLTITTNAAGIVTTIAYDAAKTFPITESTTNFVTSFVHDNKSGALVWSKDAKGLVSSNVLDGFFRLTSSWVSGTSNGTPNIWLEKRSYNLGGISSGSSANYVKVERNDTTSANPGTGLDSYTYSDGTGRVIQTRSESETNTVFRVTQSVYDERGAVKLVTQPMFLSGTSYTKLAGSGIVSSVNEYDPVGRLKKSTSPMNAEFVAGVLTNSPTAISESGSAIGSLLIAYNDGSDPWTSVVTDESGPSTGLVRKYVTDGFGRTNTIFDVVSGSVYATNRFVYDRLGRITNMIDAAANKIEYAYNDLGEMVAMADPSLGFWEYLRDHAGRLKKQTDGVGNTVEFAYNDALGRTTSKTVTPGGGGTGYTNTYAYDTSSGGGYTVFPGQLSKVTDAEGSDQFSYDVRGRTLKVTRNLSVNTSSHTSEFLFDNAGRQISVKYPASGPTVTNRYDGGGNLTQVQRVDVGGSTLYFQSKGYSHLGELLGANLGNGTEINYGYYPKTRRLASVLSKKTSPANTFQSLGYTFNAVGDLLSITDSKYTSGTNSATISSVGYDNLHRLTSLTRPTGATAFTYNQLGNMLSNGEQGGTTYTYPGNGLLPHAVRQVGTNVYGYDLVGNMTHRKGQALSYDPENRLKKVVYGGNTLATFGYDDGGTRLWKQNTNTLNVWIGDLYEARGSTNLFHIFAGSKRVATYSPANQLPGASGTTGFHYYHPDHLGSSSLLTDATGAVAEHYEYSAYGRERANGGAAPDASHRFTGQVFDAEIGLYYYGARYYDADLGRFIQADTIIPSMWDPQSWNRYTYTLNNPLKYVDPTGHQSITYGALNRELLEEEGHGDLVQQSINSTAQIKDTTRLIVESFPPLAIHAGATGAPLFPDEEKRGLAERGMLLGGALLGPAAKTTGTVMDVGKGLSNMKKAADALDKASDASIPLARKISGATARGRAAEKRVLDEMGLAKNAEKVSTKEGNAIPDALNEAISLEVKDTKVVNKTKQIRIQTDAAKTAGRKSVLVTGQETKISGPAQKSFDTVIQRPDLGPKQ